MSAGTVSAGTRARPTGGPAADGGMPARRAVVRWAWRLFRREWRQEILILALVTVAVAATIVGAGVGVNGPPPATAIFGTANTMAVLPGTDPHLARDAAAIGARFGPVDVIENRNLATGSTSQVQLRAQNPHGPFGGPMLSLVSGHYPAGPGQVALTRQVASLYDVGIGGRWQAAGRTWNVVGIVENPTDLLDEFALVAPGQVISPTQVSVLFDAAGGIHAQGTARIHLPKGGVIERPGPANQGLSPAVVVMALAVFGLIFVGLVSVAGFTVLAERRLRALGMLSSLGASDRNIRLVMMTNGALVGIVGAILGAALGLAAWIAYTPYLSHSAGHRVVWTNLPWWVVAAAVVLAVVTATLASRRPARSVARMPVVAALSGRPAVPKAVRRSAVPGLVLLAGGLVLVANSGGWGGNSGRDTLFLLGGLLATAFGLLLLSPLGVSTLGRRAAGAPVAVRIALRDLARYRARSGAALAAISLAVLIAATTALVATGRYADAVDYFGPNLPANQMAVYAPGGLAGPGPTGPGGQAPAGLQRRANEIAGALGTRNVVKLELASAMVVHPTPAGLTGHGNVYVATPALLRHYGIDPRAIDPTTLLITSRPGLQGTPKLELQAFGAPRTVKGPEAFTTQTAAVTDPRIQTFHQLPSDTSDPNLLVTPYAVARYHIHVEPGAWLIQTPAPLTAAQINTARQMAENAHMSVETRSSAPSLAELRNWATIAGIVLALGVLAMTVGLIRSETAGDLRVLTATGASSRIRRAIAGTTAGALGLVGAVLGTAVAYVLTAAFFRGELSERMSQVPAFDLVLILVGLPAAALIGGWLLAGREPAEIARRPLE